jgi:hypothetical protein
LTQSIETSLEWIADYLGRVQNDLERGDREQALADAAALSETSRRLWSFLANQEGYSAEEAQMKLAAGDLN